MWPAFRSSWALFLGIGMLVLAVGLQNSLLGIRAGIADFPTSMTGFIMSAYYVGFLGGSLATPRYVMRVGHVRVFAAMASVVSTTALLHSVFVDPYAWFFIRLACGFASASLFIVAESWLNDISTNRTRGSLLAIYMVVVLGGLAGGQFLLTASDPGGYVLFIIASLLFSLSLVPVLMSVTQAPSFSTHHPISLKQLFEISPLGTIGSVATGAAQGALFGMGAVYAAQLGLKLSSISLLMALFFTGGMLLQFPLGHLSDRYDRRLVMAFVTFGASAIAAIGIALSLLIDNGESLDQTKILLPVLWGIAVFFGGLSLPIYSLAVSHTNDYLKPEQMVSASAALYVMFGVGSALGPFATGLMMTFSGSSGFFIILLFIHLLLGLYTVYRMRIRKSLPSEEQSGFTPAFAAATPMVAELSSTTEEQNPA